MKTLLVLSLLVFTSFLSAQSNATPEESLRKVENLTKEGNHREAADLAKTWLEPQKAADGKTRAELLGLVVTTLLRINQIEETESVIEKAAKDFAEDWRVLAQAARSFQRLPDSGMVIDGMYHRGSGRERGEWKRTQVRDRVRVLQLLHQARLKIPESVTPQERYDFNDKLISMVARGSRGNYQAWRLQILTDLEKLPSYDDEEGYDDPASGYPVDANGEPVWFRVPASYETAANDGERIRSLLDQNMKLGGTLAAEARRDLAEILQIWFSVSTLDMGGFWGRDREDEGKVKEGIAALHTLKDSETVSKLATGPKRFTLPPEQDFMRLYRELSEDESLSKDWRVMPLEKIAQELTSRRQYVRAAELLKKAVAWEEDKDSRDSYQARLDQIVKDWGRLESLPPQPAGRGAKLSLVYRNATNASFTARKVDVLRLIEDTKAYLKTEPQGNDDWWRRDVNSIGQRLLREGQGKYLGKVVAKWETKLEPAADHWDKRVEITSPLQNGGAYLIEAKIGKGNTARCLLWVEDLVMVETKQAGASQYYLADAKTGLPVLDATISFFGFRTVWIDSGIFRKKPRQEYSFKEFNWEPDEDGVVSAKADGKDFHYYQWLVMARDKQDRIAFHGFTFAFVSRGLLPAVESLENERQYQTVYSITDRPVYRPGQVVKWKAWARRVSYESKADSNPYAGTKLQVAISNQRGEKVFERELKADMSGAVEGELLLGDDATLGEYSVAIWNERAGLSATHSFRVEEYKKPEFEVKVEAPEKPVSLGDSFEVTVKADYYFGGPVKEAKVKCRIERTAKTDRWFPMGRWDWLYGKGYSWRSVSYDWYPNSAGWCRCIAPWPWMRFGGNPPELIASGESAIGADGTFKVKVDTALAKELHGDEDHEYKITAEVTDASRRTVFGSGTVLAARRAFEIYASLDQGYYQAGEAATVRLSAKTLDERAVKAAGKVKVLRLSYQTEQPVENEVAVFDLKTDDEGEASQKLKWEKAGQYRLAVTLKDEAGHEVEASVFTNVRGEGFENGKGLRFDDLELAVKKEEYAVGEEVEVLVNSNHENARVVLFIRASNGVYPDPVWLNLDGKSGTHRFKIEERDQPNLFIEAFTVRDAKVHQVTRQIIVPPAKQIATVELITDKTEYLPQQKPKVTIRVKDQSGKPFEGDVILTGYDKALEYISGGSNQQDIREFFWGWKRSHSPAIQNSLRHSEAGMMKEGELGMMNLARLGDMMSMGKTFATSAAGGGFGGLGGGGGFGAGGTARTMSLDMAPVPASAPVMAIAAAPEGARLSGGSSPEAQPMIRSNLADSAVWLANVKTNAEGEAVLDFDLPDNLTTWSLRSWVMGPRTQVGEAKVEVITRKNLMVRLQAPRFFVEKDEVTISANVHNEMDVAQEVRAILELEGGTLQPLEPTVPLVHSVLPHSEKRFDWKVKATVTGEATIRVKALAEADSDAMEMKFPVYVHGALKTDSWSLALRPDQASGQIKIRVPEQRKPEQTRLEVRYTPTLAMSLVEALPYLADYPYGCTEQTLNRFLPTVITLDVLKKLKVDLKGGASRWLALNEKRVAAGLLKLNQPVFNPDEVMKMAKAGLQRLRAMQGNDGGWGWFPGGRESSTHITALVVHGLIQARKAGVEVQDEMLQSAFEYLSRREKEELRQLLLPEKHRDHKSQPDNLDALVHVTLVEAEKGDSKMRDKLYEHRLKLSRYNQALLGLAFHAVGEKDRRDMALRNLKQFLKQDDENQTAYLNLEGGSWWYWYDDEIETQAAFLKLLSAVEPKGELAPRIAKYLLNNRQNGTWWKSTKDTAVVIEAMAAFVKASGENAPLTKVEVLVDGKMLKQEVVTGKNLFSFDGTLVIEGAELAAGEHVIEIKNLNPFADGPVPSESPLYVNAFLTVFSQEDMIPAAGLEVKVRRAFYRLVEEKPDTKVAGARGQVVGQQGFKYSRIAIASDAEIKSGDLVEVELTIESKNDYEYVLIEDFKPAGYEPVDVRSGWTWEKLAAYQENRDEKVAFFASSLPRGTHNLSYRVKAEIPGRFSALPAKVEAMYAPDLKGNSEEWKARVIEK